MERDAKGRFIKGVSASPEKRFSAGIAEEMQLRSAAKRKKNRTVAEVLRAQLQEKAAEGQSMTRLEYLTLRAITTHAKGDMTMKDLREMQKVLGEDVKKVALEGNLGGIQIVLADSDAVAGLQRALASGGQPAEPDEDDTDI